MLLTDTDLVDITTNETGNFTDFGDKNSNAYEAVRPRHLTEQMPELHQFERLKRKKLSVRTRFKVLQRDKFTCQACGRRVADGVQLEVDHKIPLSRGGSSDIDNLWVLCLDCNRGKYNFDLVDIVQEQFVLSLGEIELHYPDLYQFTVYGLILNFTLEAEFPDLHQEFGKDAVLDRYMAATTPTNEQEKQNE